MNKVIDLSFPITDRAPCTFATADKVPIVTFEEGDSHGLFFVTSRIDNLYSNAGTQIDFPAHLAGTSPTSSNARKTFPTVGEYPIDRFTGLTAVLDFSDKMSAVQDWFSETGVFDRRRFADFDRFVSSFTELRVTSHDINDKLGQIGVAIRDLTGIIFYSGSGAYWTNEQFESWEYRYFYGPYLSSDATDLLVESPNVSFVGIDAFQIEDPVANFRGDELPLVVNRDARAQVRARLASWQGETNHECLLGNGILIYESLNVPPDAVDLIGQFSGPPLNLQLAGLDDDALARPYLVIEG